MPSLYDPISRHICFLIWKKGAVAQPLKRHEFFVSLDFTDFAENQRFSGRKARRRLWWMKAGGSGPGTGNLQASAQQSSLAPG